MCCCCGASPNQSHLALTINSGILFALFLIMSCVMVSSTNDYKIVKAFIESHESSNSGNNIYSITESLPNNYKDFDASTYEKYANTLTISATSNSLRYAKWFKNLKKIEMGIIIPRLIVMTLIFGCLIFQCILENKKTLPINGPLYNIFLAVYIVHIVFHIVFSILSIVLGIAELLALLQYGLLLLSNAKISGPILKRAATQIAFTGFFFVYELVFICLIAPILGMFRRKELVGQGFDPYKKGASNSATSRELNDAPQNIIKKINE